VKTIKKPGEYYQLKSFRWF